MLGHVTVMVDMDAQHDLTRIYNTMANGKPTIVDVLKGNCTVDDACLEVRKNLYLILGDPGIKNLSMKKSSRMLGSLLKNADELKDGGVEFVIMDTPPGIGDSVMMAYAAADSVLMVTEPEKFDAENMSLRLKEVAEIQQTLNKSISILGIVINQLDARRGLAKRTVKKLKSTFRSHIFTTIISNESSVPTSQDREMHVRELGWGKTASQFRRIALEALQRMGVQNDND